jgi:uncharacterized protein YjbJ (UPF0337 family)
MFFPLNHDVMKALRIKGNWIIVRGKIKQMYSKLIGDDRLFARGLEEEFNGRFQREAHIGNEQLIDAIGNL